MQGLNRVRKLLISCLFTQVPSLRRNCNICKPIGHARGYAPRGFGDPGEMARRALILLPGVLSALRILLPTTNTSCALLKKEFPLVWH